MPSFTVTDFKKHTDECGNTWPNDTGIAQVRLQLESGKVYKDTFANLMEFPTHPADFHGDSRIWKEDGVYHLMDDHEQEWEFKESSSKWNKLKYHDLLANPGINDEDVEQFQQGFAHSPEAQETAPTQTGKKRKNPPSSNDKAKVQENRAIFISNLPKDTTLTELEDQFSKYGLIDMSVDGTKRVKMYLDDIGEFKGEALIVYFKKDSVQLAIDMADGFYLRYGGERMSVKEADMSFKRNQDTEVVRSKMGRKEKKEKERALAEMNRRLTDWDSGDEAASLIHNPPPVNKFAKNVIIKNAFSLEELDEDVQAISDIKEDFQEAGAEYGTVTNVIVYDREPAGIVTVRFSEEAAAEQFAKKANGMQFGDRGDGVQQYLTAYVAQDKPKFKKSGKGTESDEEEEAARLERFVNEDTS
ncbi:hypothetical protein K491DRAFT_323337 [Lophiostoma macrostomum CBS 122681]|uniref:RRM domain-containing protein n=1 Tax=Lophiostoma macrostomum CBS 122681 TaxID=1314788 RepID=A0A6A6TCG0_9PLEO|nr:hypothetical protein K491DRAFT_323337 [Lophiostoma macrostomum CBS 122681]